MRDPKRIDKITTLLGKLWHKYPDMRLAQLLCFIKGNNEYDDFDDFYVEDNIWAKWIKNKLEVKGDQTHAKGRKARLACLRTRKLRCIRSSK